ncbi:MAG: tyrosine--tRNA ligase [Planctomycetia bacterium]|nr:tyrosine--tRNA ligase [Planctomycetia bacterium]
MFDLHTELNWRGLIHQTTLTNPREWLMEKPRTLYCGFDPTADSLHVGHLMALVQLRRFQRAGHRPIALVGGATGAIGDPSGKSVERNQLSREQIVHNVESIRPQMERFLDFDCGENSAMLLDNFDWCGKISFLDFLRDIGKHFSVNVMLTKDSVKSRLSCPDSSLSYTEFSYMLLQSYDFVHLNQTYGCELQIGGSDQWGNITAGGELARRMNGAQLHGITCPLLTKSDGKKMGKTEKGALWLNPDRCSPYTFYQYWINVPDEDIGKPLRYFTDFTSEEVAAMEADHAADPGKRGVQRQVAAALTRLVHGDSGLESALRATQIFFGAEIDRLTDAELGEIFADVPGCERPRSELTETDAQGLPGISAVDALVMTGLCRSKSDARRRIEQGGAYLNNRRITDVAVRLTPESLVSETTLVLRSGRKDYALLRFPVPKD